MANKSKKAKGTGTIRHKTVVRNGKEYSYWEGRVTVGHDPLTGKQIQKSFTGSTQAEVRKKINAVQLEIDNDAYLEPSKMTVGQWLDIWVEDFSNEIKVGTKVLRKNIIRLYLKPTVGNIKLTSLNTLQIQKMYNNMVSVKNGEELAPQYRKTIHFIFHASLQSAVKAGIIKQNPADNVILPKVPEESAGRVLEDEDIAAFIKAADKRKLSKMLKFLLFTGLRRGEVCGLSWDQVNFETGEITISQQLQRSNYLSGEYRIVTTKSGRSRKICPAPAVMELLRERKEEQLRAIMLSGGKWYNPYNLVFTVDTGSHPGRHILPATLYNELKRVVKSIGLPEVRVHDLRHTYAVISLRSGDDIKTVQENLGHASAEFTMRRYIHVTNDMRRESSNHMEEYISRVKDA